MPRIDIKGIDANGGERLITKEIRESLNISIDEATEIFNDRYPIFEEGVIRFKINNKGTYYIHFKVFNLQEKTFGIKITQYKFYNNVFYMTFQVEIKEISKKAFPCYIGEKTGLDVRTILFTQDYFGNDTIKQFTQLEQNIIVAVISEGQPNVQDECETIVYQTLSYFAGINYIKNQYANEINRLWDNEYFSLKNWEINSPFYDMEYSFKDTMNIYCDNIISKYKMPRILKKNTIEMIINRIAEKEKIISVSIAVGFVFSSGLKRLEPLFESVKNNGGVIELIIGSLQHYENKSNTCKIDLKTAKKLNDFRERYNLKLYTYLESFYHGKIYLMATKNDMYVILGSSNVSKMAFASNYEMDALFKLKKDDSELLEFSQNYSVLRDSCTEIEYLNEARFKNIDWQADLMPYHMPIGIDVSETKIKEKINALTDEETKYRLSLWLKYRPDAYYQEFGVEALKDYTLFFYEEKEIVVFESFVPGNAYYVFQSIRGIDDLIKNIKSMTKTEMKKSELFVDRGNHTYNKKRLENRIISFFS